MSRPTVAQFLAGPRGRGVTLAAAAVTSGRVHAAWLHAAWQPDDRNRLADLLRALGAVDPAVVCSWQDELELIEPMDRTVSRAMYWQPADREDVIAARPQVVEALAPIAEALLAAAATRWWSTPIDLSALRVTSVSDDPGPPAVTGVSARLEQWRRDTVVDERRAAVERPSDPTARFSGRWWSTPAEASAVTTTRPLPGLASVGLAWQEDSPGLRTDAVWTVTTTREPRVWEVDGPDAWTKLVGRYPLDVTNARRHDWYRTTGRVGRWLVPDWSAVGSEWDAVHVSVMGYLTTATRALPVAESATAATVLAGWNPDQTWWLSDILITTAGPQLWRRTDECIAGWAPITG